MEIISFRGGLISNGLIDLKFDRNVGYRVVHVQTRNSIKIISSNCKLQIYADYHFLQIIVCTVLTDLY